MKQFHLLKDRFLFDDFDSGLYFDLFPIKRPAGDEDVFNGVINESCEALEKIEPKGQAWLPTLFLTEGQIDKLPEKYRAMFSGKTYLLLFKAGFLGNELPNNIWFDQMAGGMVCNPTGSKASWKYYTDWDAEALGHRFRRVEKSEVDEFEFDDGSVVVTPPANDDDPVTPPADVPAGGLTMHLVCPHCGKKIF